jgi:phosphatidylinositol alpha-1,6-mannosyltransferase
MPSRQELFRAFASADLFVMLSENQKNGDLEGFGIAILEANAFGLPAIGASGCGIEDAISPESGILIDGNDASAMVHAMERILENKQAFSKGARHWAEQHNWAELIKELPI